MDDPIKISAQLLAKAGACTVTLASGHVSSFSARYRSGSKMRVFVLSLSALIVGPPLMAPKSASAEPKVLPVAQRQAGQVKEVGYRYHRYRYGYRPYYYRRYGNYHPWYYPPGRTGCRCTELGCCDGGN